MTDETETETMAQLARDMAAHEIAQGWLDYARRSGERTYTLTPGDIEWAEDEAGEPVDARDLERRVQRILLDALDDGGAR